MENCSNLREASDQFIRFQNLCFGLTRFQKIIEGDYSVLTHSFTYPVSDYEHKLITEVNFSVCAAAMRNLIGKDITFHEVRFSHEEPDYSEFYRNHFRSTLKFNQAEDAIVMHRGLGAVAVPGSYSHLKDILSEYAENLLAAREEERTFKDKVKRIVSDLLPKGAADIENVSSKLCMSRWTLNRRLRKEGTRFQEILMELRREFATAYLDNRNLTIAEIAFLLGYSEQSAFFRAFKKWTGITPNQYREQQDSELPEKLAR
jgi:AraC-like DNA-binding protein